MLIVLLAVTLALLFGGVALPRLWVAPPAFWAHLVLAVGVMGLITAAMQHFVPVLARSRGAGPWLARLPWLMLAAGVLAAVTLLGWLDRVWIVPAALIALAGTVLMLRWMLATARAALGGPHPGLAWYVAAMACLAAGLAAAALMPWWPEWHAVLRAFHVHINLYGFVALTAVGTLQVLMPTVAKRPDPGAGPRLRSDLKWALAGSILLASGQAADKIGLAGAGVALWGWVLIHMVRAWIGLFGRRLVSLHGNEPVLLAATAGLAAAMLGALGVGLTPGPLSIFLPGFLMPLVSARRGSWRRSGCVPAGASPGTRPRSGPSVAGVGRGPFYSSPPPHCRSRATGAPVCRPSPRCSGSASCSCAGCCGKSRQDGRKRCKKTTLSRLDELACKPRHIGNGSMRPGTRPRSAGSSRMPSNPCS